MLCTDPEFQETHDNSMVGRPGDSAGLASTLLFIFPFLPKKTPGTTGAWLGRGMLVTAAGWLAGSGHPAALPQDRHRSPLCSSLPPPSPALSTPRPHRAPQGAAVWRGGCWTPALTARPQERGSHAQTMAHRPIYITHFMCILHINKWGKKEP